MNGKTRGQATIGDFNVSGKSEVDIIKQKSAELIDLIDEYAKDPRRASIAITLIEQAQMMAVKAIFS